MNREVLSVLMIACAFAMGIAFQHQHEIYAQSQKVYELRIYTTAEGRLPPLLDRFSGGEIDYGWARGRLSTPLERPKRPGIHLPVLYNRFEE